MKLLRDACVAAFILAGWMALGYWQINNSSAEAQTMPIYHTQPPACKLLTNNYFDYDFSSQPPQLAGWYQREYVECPVAGGMVVIE